jgi:hypothetical protein
MTLPFTRADPFPHVTQFRDVFLVFGKNMPIGLRESTMDKVDRLMDGMRGKPGLHELGDLTFQVFVHTRESTLEKFVSLLPDVPFGQLKTIFSVARGSVPLDHFRPLLAPVRRDLEKMAATGINLVPHFINTLGGLNPREPGSLRIHQELLGFMVEEGFFTDGFLALALPNLMGNDDDSPEWGTGLLCRAMIDHAQKNLDALLEEAPVSKSRPARL